MKAFVNGVKPESKRIGFVVTIGLIAAAFLLLIEVLWGRSLFITDQLNGLLLAASSSSNKSVSTSGGYIIEHNGFYYYANPNDGNRLYQADSALKNHKRLSDHVNGSPYIQMTAAGNRLLYLRNNRTVSAPFQNELCYYDLETAEERVIFDKNVVSYIVVGDWIYCETVSPAQSYRLRLDGTSVEAFGNEYPDAFAKRMWAVFEDTLIFSTNEAITKFNPVSGQTESFQGDSASFAVEDSYIYSINYNDDYSLERYDAETMSYSDKTYIVSKNVQSFTLLEKTLVYATQNGTIWMKDLTDKHGGFLTFGSDPTICGQFLFYRNRNGMIGYFGLSTEGVL